MSNPCARFVLAAAVAAFLGAVVRLSAQEVATPIGGAPPQLKQQLVGSGHWQSRRSGGDTQGWQIQVQRMDDDSLSGRITIVGSPLIQQARIEGQVFGSEVDGVIVGDDNVQLATFTGSIAQRAMSGTYTTTDGDSGNWSWDGGRIDSLGDRVIGPLIGSSGDPAIGPLGKGSVDGPAVSDQPSPADQAAAEIEALGLVAPGEQ